MATENLILIVEELNFVGEVSGGFLSDPAIYIKLIMGSKEFKTKTAYG